MAAIGTVSSSFNIHSKRHAASRADDNRATPGARRGGSMLLTSRFSCGLWVAAFRFRLFGRRSMLEGCGLVVEKQMGQIQVFRMHLRILSSGRGKLAVYACTFLLTSQSPSLSTMLLGKANFRQAAY